jgi:glutaminyl-peptide cyclotransferase
MRACYLKYFVFLTSGLLISWTISCSGRSGSTTGKETESAPSPAEEPAAKIINMVSPEENAEFKLNDAIKVILAAESEKVIPDSVQIWFDGKLTRVLKTAPWEYTIPSSFTEKTGRKALKAVAFRKGDKTQSITRFMIIYSDITPKKYGYRVVKTYPHDREAFTQGLVYDRGIFFEGTGQVNKSSLRKVKIETGEVINQLNLESPLFGEGIALAGEKIYQLTWESKVGFVYDKNTFKQLSKFYYQTEGWGLTTIGDKLVMSDGTNVLYFIEPETFATISKIEVYDNKVKVSKLNELEYINGEIWANIWQTDLIARIDPKTGKVLAYINLGGILPAQDKDANVDVLNGIAYDPVGKRIFVTGKNWPKLFEISLTE